MKQGTGFVTNYEFSYFDGLLHFTIIWQNSLKYFFLATTKRVYPTRPPQIVGNKVSKKENKTSVAKSLPGRPADVNKWGREGEKFRPGMVNNPSNQAVQQQSDNMQGM